MTKVTEQEGNAFDFLSSFEFCMVENRRFRRRFCIKSKNSLAKTKNTQVFRSPPEIDLASVEEKTHIMLF